MKNKDERVSQQSALPKTEVDLVITLYTNGKIDEAIDAIKLLNEEYPNVPLLFNILGACYKSLDQLELAS
tara:strand:- start:1185 stop:1394 length:210 start_codon:yes stop_codon:yes gene_type:complete